MCIPNSPKPPRGITRSLFAKGLPKLQSTDYLYKNRNAHPEG